MTQTQQFEFSELNSNTWPLPQLYQTNLVEKLKQESLKQWTKISAATVLHPFVFPQGVHGLEKKEVKEIGEMEEDERGGLESGKGRRKSGLLRCRPERWALLL